MCFFTTKMYSEIWQNYDRLVFKMLVASILVERSGLNSGRSHLPDDLIYKKTKRFSHQAFALDVEYVHFFCILR